MAPIIIRSIQRLARNRDGAAALEFAIVSVPLLGLIIASMQVGIVFYFSQVLQTVAVESARNVMTGTVQTAGMTAGQFKTNVVCPNASTAFTCANLMVDVQSASSFTSLTTTPIALTYSGNSVTNSWGYNPGGAGDIVILRVMYDWPVIGGPLFNMSNQPNSTYLLVGTAVFKNEPYS